MVKFDASIKRNTFFWKHYLLLACLSTRILVTCLALMGLYYIDINIRFQNLSETILFLKTSLIYILPEVIISFIFPYLVWARPIQNKFWQLIKGKSLSNEELKEVGEKALCFPRRQIIFDFITGNIICLIPIAIHMNYLGFANKAIFHMYIGGTIAILLDMVYAFLILNIVIRKPINFFYYKGFRLDYDTPYKNKLFNQFFIPILIISLIIVLILGTLAYHQNSEYIYRFEDLRNRIVLIIIITAFFTSSLSYLLTHNIASKVKNITNAVSRIKERDFSIRVNDIYQDEIGLLSQTLNEMTGWLDDLTQNLENKVEERTKDLIDANEKLRNAQEELVKLEKYSAIGVLAGGMAHELNNPIAAIRSYIQDVLEDLPQDSPLEDRLKKAEHATQRCKRIISDLLTFSRQETLKKSCNINKVIQQTVSLAKKELALPELVFETEFDEQISEIMLDPLQIQQVLMNLINNAKDAMDGKGTIKVKSIKNEDNIAVEVSDQGHGISLENQAKLFDPFFTTKAPGKGMGLGLALSYNIIKRYSGDIKVESQPGQGSRFTISLPF